MAGYTLLDGEAAAPQVVSVPGSARLAMKATPSFDRYYFVEKDENHCAALRRVAADFPDRSIECHCADANRVIQRICRETPWHGRIGTRGVAFLDPTACKLVGQQWRPSHRRGQSIVGTSFL